MPKGDRVDTPGVGFAIRFACRRISAPDVYHIAVTLRGAFDLPLIEVFGARSQLSVEPFECHGADKRLSVLIDVGYGNPGIGVMQGLVPFVVRYGSGRTGNHFIVGRDDGIDAADIGRVGLLSPGIVGKNAEGQDA